jgi:predicted HicB family RNase H-like nuclease
VKDEKKINVRMPHDVWRLLKDMSFEKNISMNTLILNALGNLKKSSKKQLTITDTMIS